MRICPRPFVRDELQENSFIPCCTGWLTDEFLELSRKHPGWNNQAAQELRERIYAGDYRYCKRDVCGVYLREASDFRVENSDHFTTERNIAAIENKQTVLPDGPTTIALSHDPQCNLKCPSCRKDYVLRSTPALDNLLAETEAKLEAYAKELRVIRFTNGDPFYSPWMRKIIKGLNKEAFPHLKKVFLMTNGLLLNEKAVKDLYPGFDLVTHLIVSIDAGDAPTYELVRGGHWESLIRNLAWVRDELKKRQALHLETHFILQKNNFKSLPRFVALMKELQADHVQVLELQNWENMKLRFEEHAVHLPGHPLHAELIAVLREVRSDAGVELSPSLARLCL